MSTSEQAAVIGQLVMDRAEAKREQALLTAKIRSCAEKLGSLSHSVKYSLDAERLQKAKTTAAEIEAEGGMVALTGWLADYERVSEKIAGLETTLRAAQIPF
jgi:dTDP-D-glucose 4,6-dehydratase